MNCYAQCCYAISSSTYKGGGGLSRRHDGSRITVNSGLVGECDNVHIARSWTHKNVRRRCRGSWQRSSMSLSSAVPAWFPVSGHDLLQTAGLRSCSAIANRTDPAREVQYCSALSWPSACHCIVFSVHRDNVCLPPMHY